MKPTVHQGAKLICIKWVEGLTVGDTYTEVATGVDHLLACVTNDEGEYQDVDRSCLERIHEDGRMGLLSQMGARSMIIKSKSLGDAMRQAFEVHQVKQVKRCALIKGVFHLWI